MSVRSVSGFFAVGALVGALSAPAHAEPAGNIDLNVFRPAMDSRGYLTINASQVLGHNELSFGLGALDWGHNMLNLDGNGAEYSIDNIISATIIAAYGLKLGPAEIELGASIPLTILKGDRAPDPGPMEDEVVDGQGLGSVGFHLKTRFLKTSRAPHIGVGVIGSIYLPTTDPENRFLGETTVVPQIMGILDKEFGRQGRLRIALNGGIRIRKTTTFTNNDAPTATGQSITVGNEIPYGLGIAYAISRQKFDIVGEVFGSIPLGTNENYMPLEAIGGIKVYLARNSFL
ncbi:MAG TPA: hypothetical protein VIU61_01230, partial [Kofleriaceae bacterium]